MTQSMDLVEIIFFRNIFSAWYGVDKIFKDALSLTRYLSGLEVKVVPFYKMMLCSVITLATVDLYLQ